MYNNKVQTSVVIILAVINTVSCGYSIEITSNAPVVVGAAVTFNATVYDGGHPATDSLKFEWMDNSLDQHSRVIEKESPYDSWVVNYSPKKRFPPGPYIVQVVVTRYIFFIPYQVASQRKEFFLTETLNGNMTIMQDNQLITKEYVSNSSTVSHEIILNEPERNYLNKSATSVLTYWFIDCQYFGMTNDYKLEMNYTVGELEHKVEALVIASFDPLPPPPTTTPQPPTTTTQLTTSTANPNATTYAPKQKRSVITNFGDDSTKGIVANFNGNFIPANSTVKSYNESVQFICSNNTIIPLGGNISYGYYSRNIIVKQPVSDIVITGNNWLQHGEMLQLSVACRGSSVFNYCYMFKRGIHNITGNETCIFPDVSEKCDFPIRRLFISDDNDKETAIIVIYNDVSKVVKQVTITVYKVTTQAQLSVIVVPVAFSLIAVVLIVFGVAYYIQNRTRFIVEVADFNFGQQYGDMEYKTFRERLRDSISNAFTRAPIPGSSEGPVWPPSRKYGSMT